MNKLTIRIERWGRTIVYKVLQQDESLRCNCNFVASNGISVISQYYPKWDREAIYIRGSKKIDDEEVFNGMFETEELAENFRLKVLEAVEELNTHK